MNWLLPLMLALSAPALAQVPAGTRSPDEVEQQQRMVQKAEEFLQANDFAKARDLLIAAVKADSKDARAAYDLGVAEDAMSHDAAARAAYLAAITADRNQFEAHLALGLLLAREGDLTASREQLLISTGLTPANGDVSLRARAWRVLAQIDAGKNDAEARRDLAEALKLSAETADDRALEARVAITGGNASDAEAILRKSLAASPGDPATVSSLAQVLTNSGKLDDAVVLLISSLQQRPSDPVLSKQLAGIYMRQQKTPEAVGVLEPVQRAHPEDAPVALMLAALYVQSGQAPGANALYESLLKANPDDPELLDEFGSSLVRQNRAAEAQTIFQKALAGLPGQTPPRRRAEVAAHLAFAASANKDSETVLRALAVRDAAEPPSASSLFLSATAHDRLHHTKLAVEFYRQFLTVAAGRYPNEEWEARHRLLALERKR